jgi:DNA mismatch endonuclease (patch repair protein)
MDSVSRETRSRVMAQVRSNRNRSTEWRVRACLIRSGIRGWTLNSAGLIGKPDFVFPMQRLVVFVDGCFWHGCPRCYRRPASHTEYWDAKRARNRARDKKVTSGLKKEGWNVLRIWEHQLSAMDAVVEKIQSLLEQEGRKNQASRL